MENEHREEDVLFLIAQEERSDLLMNSNLLIVPSSLLTEITNELITLFFASHHYEEQFTSLRDQLLSCRSYASFLDLCASFLERSLVLIDAGFRVIAHSKSVPVTDELWLKYIRKGYCSRSFLEAMRTDMPEETIPPDERAFLLNCSYSTETKMISALYKNNVLLGYLILLDNDRSILSHHREYLERIARLAMELTDKEPSLTNLFSRSFSASFARFLHNPEQDGSLNRRIRKELEEGPMHILCIEPKQKSNRDLLYLMNRLSILNPGTLRYAYNGCIYSLIRDVSVLEDPEYAPESVTMMANIGVYENMRDLTEINEALQHAKKAIDTGRLLSNEKHIFRFRELAADILLQENLNTPAVRALTNPLLEQLDDSLLDTLEAFILCSGNRKECAAYLGIHRNTLQYRISRIEQTLQVYLEDLSVLLDLKLSLHILKLHRSLH